MFPIGRACGRAPPHVRAPPVFVTERYRLAAVPGRNISVGGGTLDLLATLLLRPVGGAGLYVRACRAPRGSSPSRAATSASGRSITTAGIRAPRPREIALERQNPAAAAVPRPAQQNHEPRIRYVPKNADIYSPAQPRLRPRHIPLQTSKQDRQPRPRPKCNARPEPQSPPLGTTHNCGVLEMMKALARRTCFSYATLRTNRRQGLLSPGPKTRPHEMGKPENQRIPIEYPCAAAEPRQFLELPTSSRAPPPKPQPHRSSACRDRVPQAPGRLRSQTHVRRVGHPPYTVRSGTAYSRSCPSPCAYFPPPCRCEKWRWKMEICSGRHLHRRGATRFCSSRPAR